MRDQASVQAEGLNRRACWLGSKRLLAVLVRHGSLWRPVGTRLPAARPAGCSAANSRAEGPTLHGLAVWARCTSSAGRPWPQALRDCLLSPHAARCLTRRCAQTYHSVLHIYGVHTSKEAVLAAPALLAGYAPEADFRRADIYLQHSISLASEAVPGSATDVVADSRALLVAFSNGTCQLHSWAGKARAHGPAPQQQSPAKAAWLSWLSCMLCVGALSGAPPGPS